MVDGGGRNLHALPGRIFWSFRWTVTVSAGVQFDHRGTSPSSDLRRLGRSIPRQCCTGRTCWRLREVCLVVSGAGVGIRSRVGRFLEQNSSYRCHCDPRGRPTDPLQRSHWQHWHGIVRPVLTVTMPVLTVPGYVCVDRVFFDKFGTWWQPLWVYSRWFGCLQRPVLEQQGAEPGQHVDDSNWFTRSTLALGGVGVPHQAVQGRFAFFTDCLDWLGGAIGWNFGGFMNISHLRQDSTPPIRRMFACHSATFWPGIWFVHRPFITGISVSWNNKNNHALTIHF